MDAEQNPAVLLDEYHGMGGAYVMVDGKRVPETPPPQPSPAEQRGGGSPNPEPSDADDGDAQPE